MHYRKVMLHENGQVLHEEDQDTAQWPDSSAFVQLFRERGDQLEDVPIPLPRYDYMHFSWADLGSGGLATFSVHGAPAGMALILTGADPQLEDQLMQMMIGCLREIRDGRPVEVTDPISLAGRPVVVVVWLPNPKVTSTHLAHVERLSHSLMSAFLLTRKAA